MVLLGNAPMLGATGWSRIEWTFKSVIEQGALRGIDAVGAGTTRRLQIRTQSMKRCSHLASATTALLLGTIVGCDRSNTFQPPPPPAVTVANPVQEEVTTYDEFPGRLEAAFRAEVRARVTGFLRTVEFEPGDIVEEGALLFTIEPEPFEADLAVSEAAQAQAEAALQLATEFLRRVEAASERDAATQFEVLDARAQLDEAKAGVQAAEANVQNASIQLSYTKVYAPFAGRLSENLVDVGNLVSGAEATLLTTIVADDPIHAYFDVDERKLLEFLQSRPLPQDREKPNRPAFLRLLDGTDYQHAGHVDFANNELDASTGAIRVRASIPNPDERLYPGLFVRIRVPNETMDRILVPEVAIQRDQIGPYLLAVDQGNTVVRKDVTLGGFADSKRRIITSGIETSDRIVVVGLQRARPGAPVDPKAAAPAPATTPAAPAAGDGSEG